MKLLLNPINGADIHDVNYNGQMYFVSPDTFKTGTMLQFDDRLATFLQNLFEFLEEMSPAEAKEFLTRKNSEFACDKCDFKSITASGLAAHQKKHIKDVPIEGLDIPVVEVKDAPVDAPVEPPIAVELPQDAKELEGEGFTEEKPVAEGKMS